MQQWLAHAFVGAGNRSSLLSMEGGRYVAKGQFPGGNWSEIVVLIGNAESAAVDLSKSKGFEITYSATAPLWMQMRGNVKLHGGDQHVVALPATGGMTVTKFVPFEPAAWTFAPGLGKPTHALADVVKSASFFDIVGNAANTVKFSGLRFDGYVPPCR